MDLPKELENWWKLLLRRSLDIDGGAPKDSIRVNQAGDVGFSTLAPKARVDVPAGSAVKAPLVIGTTGEKLPNDALQANVIENDGFFLYWTGKDANGNLVRHNLISDAVQAMIELFVDTFSFGVHAALDFISGFGVKLIGNVDGSVTVKTSNPVQVLTPVAGSPDTLDVPIDDVPWSEFTAVGDTAVTLTGVTPLNNKYVIKVTNGVGAYNLTWTTTVLWAGGAAPVPSQTMGETDLITLLLWEGDWYGDIGANFA